MYVPYTRFHLLDRQYRRYQPRTLPKAENKVKQILAFWKVLKILKEKGEYVTFYNLIVQKFFMESGVNLIFQLQSVLIYLLINIYKKIFICRVYLLKNDECYRIFLPFRRAIKIKVSVICALYTVIPHNIFSLLFMMHISYVHM